MIDIVFLLLIFFIVTQTTIEEISLFTVNLPTPGNPGTKEVTQPPFYVEVSQLYKDQQKDMNYYVIQNRIYPFDAVKNMLKNLKTNKDTTLIISCGPNARHEKLMNLLDTCQDIELTNLSIVNNESIPYRGRI
jgi:biopolymer transport protein ExbD